MTLGTANKTKQDAGKAQVEPKDSFASGAGLGGKEGGAETKPKKTYSQSEYDSGMSKAGQRKQAELEATIKERDLLKTQLNTVVSEIVEAKQSIASMNEEIKAMAEDDPDKKETLRLRREAQAKLKDYEAKEAKLVEREKPILKREREDLVYTVADEYGLETGEEKDRFMERADKHKIGTDREALEALAETMGFKSKGEAETEEKPALHSDSGTTRGGGISDDEFERQFGSGKVDMTPANLKRAKDIIDKRLKGG